MTMTIEYIKKAELKHLHLMKMKYAKRVQESFTTNRTDDVKKVLKKFQKNLTNTKEKLSFLKKKSQK